MYPGAAGVGAVIRGWRLLRSLARGTLPRIQRRESRESKTLWRSLGRAAPAYSPRKTRQSQYACAKTHSASPPTPFSVPAFPRLLRPPSGSPHENAQARSELIKPDNRTTLENALMAITTHGGIGTEHNASRSVWRYAANSRRERTQDIPIGT